MSGSGFLVSPGRMWGGSGEREVTKTEALFSRGPELKEVRIGGGWLQKEI